MKYDEKWLKKKGVVFPYDRDKWLDPLVYGGPLILGLFFLMFILYGIYKVLT